MRECFVVFWYMIICGIVCIDVCLIGYNWRMRCVGR
jgi:hypothetical protein